MLRDHDGLGRLYFRALALETDALAELAVDVKQQAVLALLADEGPMTQQTLGRRLSIDRTSVVRIVDGVERLGLVERGRNRADRRTHLLTLTPDGQAAERRGGQLVARAEHRLLAGLDETERHRLTTLLAQTVSDQSGSPSA